MGLFTNRKRDEADDVAGLTEAASMLARFTSSPTPDASIPEAEQDETAHSDDTVGATMTGFTPVDATLEFAPSNDFSNTALLDGPDGLDEANLLPSAAPFGDAPSFSPESFGGFAARPASDTTTDSSEVTEAPRRRLEDRPRAQAGNVEIDRSGLLTLLGVGSNATLIDISEAHQKFVADHQPTGTDDNDAAQIKKRIRREVNSAYASFRLTHSN